MSTGRVTTILTTASGGPASSADPWGSFSDTSFPSNNLLHDLILKSIGKDNPNQQKALALIQQSIKNYNSSSATDTVKNNEHQKINQNSLGNTPLLLAIKTGNIEIAMELLKHPAVKIDLDKGLTGYHSHWLNPLHWACMLRQNELIKALLDTSAEWYIGGGKFEGWDKTHNKDEFDDTGDYSERSPFYLYVHSFFPDSSKIGSTIPIIDNNSLVLPPLTQGIRDKDALMERHSAVAYTDMLFHMKSLCLNLGFTKMENENHFQTLPSSQKTFEQNFSAGINDFQSHRNELKIDRKTANLLATGSEEEMDVDDPRVKTLNRQIQQQESKNTDTAPTPPSVSSQPKP